MGKKVLIGLVVVLSLILIIVLNCKCNKSNFVSIPDTLAQLLKPKPEFTRIEGGSYIAGIVTPRIGNTLRGIKYLSMAQSQDSCESTCESDPTCAAYTYVNEQGKSLSNQCYGLTTAPATTVGAPNHHSGLRNASGDTLMRRLGSANAGKL